MVLIIATTTAILLLLAPPCAALNIKSQTYKTLNLGVGLEDVKVQVNPNVDEAVTVKPMHRSYVDHPRAPHPVVSDMHLRRQMKGDLSGYFDEPKNLHGDIWSLVEMGEHEHAEQLQTAHRDGDHITIHEMKSQILRHENHAERAMHAKAAANKRREAMKRAKETTAEGRVTKGKAGGEVCRQDRECESGKCKGNRWGLRDGKCEESKHYLKRAKPDAAAPLPRKAQSSPLEMGKGKPNGEGCKKHDECDSGKCKGLKRWGRGKCAQADDQPGMISKAASSLKDTAKFGLSTAKSGASAVTKRISRSISRSSAKDKPAAQKSKSLPPHPECQALEVPENMIPPFKAGDPENTFEQTCEASNGHDKCDEVCKSMEHQCKTGQKPCDDGSVPKRRSEIQGEPDSGGEWVCNDGKNAKCRPELPTASAKRDSVGAKCRACQRLSFCKATYHKSIFFNKCECGYVQENAKGAQERMRENMKAELVTQCEADKKPISLETPEATSDNWRCRFRCRNLDGRKCGTTDRSIVNMDKAEVCRNFGCSDHSKECVDGAYLRCLAKSKEFPDEMRSCSGGTRSKRGMHRKPDVIEEMWSPSSRDGKPAGKGDKAIIVMQPDYWKTEFAKLKTVLVPQIRSYMCVEVDLQFPGAVLQLGLMGQMQLTPDNLCWGLTFEQSIGVFFGFKIGPVSLGINVHVAGTVNIGESPAKGRDKCSNFKAPYKLISEVVRKLKSGLTRDEHVKKRVEQARKDLENSEAYMGYLDYKRFSSFQADPLQKSYKSYSQRWPSIAHKIRAYGSQVIGRLVDNHEARLIGGNVDNCLIADIGNCKKLTQNTGRFIARHIKGAHHDRGKQLEDKKNGNKEEEKDKEEEANQQFDDRTLNFAKVARLSKFTSNPYFWREYGLSLSNLYLRIVGDLQAIFNAYYANDAEWNGECTSLPGKFHPADERGKDAGNKDAGKKPTHFVIDTSFLDLSSGAQERARDRGIFGPSDRRQKIEDGDSPWGNHHFVSKEKCDSTRRDTGEATAGFWKSSGLDPHDEAQNVYPTIVCESQTKAPTQPRNIAQVKRFIQAISEKNGAPASGAEAKNPAESGFTLFFPKACQTVINGIAYDRLECEQTKLSAAFVRTFPGLVDQIMKDYKVIESILDEFDQALHEPEPPMQGRAIQNAKDKAVDEVKRRVEEIKRKRSPGFKALQDKEKKKWDDDSGFGPWQQGVIDYKSTKAVAIKMYTAVAKVAVSLLGKSDLQKFLDSSKDIREFCKGAKWTFSSGVGETLDLCINAIREEWIDNSESGDSGEDKGVPKMNPKQGLFRQLVADIVQGPDIVQSMKADFSAAFEFAGQASEEGKPLAFANLANPFKLLKNEPEQFMKQYFDNVMQAEEKAIWRSAPPVCEYQFTITIDIETSPPGFCGPSTSLLQVVASWNWKGSTEEKSNFNMKTDCYSARIHPPNFYIMASVCKDANRDTTDLQSLEKRRDATENNEDIDAEGFFVIIDSSMYMMTGNPFDSGLKTMIEPFVAFLVQGGGPMLGAAALSSGVALSDGKSNREIMGKGLLGMMKASFPFAIATWMTDLTPDAGPVELLTNAVVQLGGPGIWIMAMFIKTLMGAAAGTLFENPKDFLVKAFKPEEITPVALKMDVVVHGAVNMEMKWRACREPEIADNWQHLVDSGSCEHTVDKNGVESSGPDTKCPRTERSVARDSMRKLFGVNVKKFTRDEYAKQCLVLKKPFPVTTDMHVVSMNRIEGAIAVPLPFPGAMAKIMPVFGLEIDLDITPVFNLVANYRRMMYNKKRRMSCRKCWYGTEGSAGTTAFCDKRFYSSDWTTADDTNSKCIRYTNEEEKLQRKAACERPHNSRGISRLIRLSEPCKFIDQEALCSEIDFPRVNEDKPPRHVLRPLKRSGLGNAAIGMARTRLGSVVAGSSTSPALLVDLGEELGVVEVPRDT